MKLFLSMLMVSQLASAEVLNCISEDDIYTFVTDVDFQAKKMNRIEYFHKGVSYKTFENLNLIHDRSVFTGRKDTYEVTFPESARYMTFIHERNGNIHGFFLPKNSIFSFERMMTCQIL